MKNLITKFFFFIVLFVSTCQIMLNAKDTGSFSKTMMYKNEQRQVHFYVPEDYDDNIRYPLVVGMQSWYTFAMSMREELKDAARELKFILACPEDPTFGGDFILLSDCISFCGQEYNIDSTNIVISGVAEGGTTAFVWGVSNPWKVKGVIGYAPWIAAVDYTMVNNRPFAAIRGKKDNQASGTPSVMREIKKNGGDTMYIEKWYVGNENDGYYHSPEFTNDYKKCFTFIQSFIPKPQVRLISPENGIYAPQEPITLKWNSLLGAGRYEINVIKGTKTVIKDTTIDTMYVLPSLDSGACYFWRVRHLYNDTAGEYSHKWSFITRSKLPEKIIPIYPQNGQKGVYVLAALSWKNDDYAEKFHIQITENNFSSPLINDTNVCQYGTSEVVYSNYKPPLKFASYYKWRVRGGNNEGWGVWSDEFSFYTYDTTTSIIENENSTSTFNTKIFPIPIKNNKLNIHFYLKESENIKISILNMTGSYCKIILNDFLEKGNISLDFNISELNPGLYFYKLESKNNYEYGKFILY